MKPVFKLLVILMFLLMTACSGSTKKAVIKPVVLTPTQTAPILTPEHLAQYNAAVLSLKSKNYVIAEKSFGQLLEHYPRLAGAYVNLALIAEARKLTDEAMGLYNKALEINPNNVDALIQRAHFNQENGRFVEAAEDLHLAEAVDSNNPLVHFNLGVIYELYLQDYEQAIQYYDNYVDRSEGEDVEMVKRWIKLLERK